MNVISFKNRLMPGLKTRLLRAMATGNIRALSVDVFDTLLLRDACPELVRFRRISCEQARILAMQGLGDGDGNSLYRARLRVHKRAYDQVRAEGIGEVRHRDILTALCAETGLPVSAVPLLAEAEWQAEVATLRLHRRLALLLSQTGLPVVLASDMYWPEEAVGRALCRLCPSLAQAPRFVSSGLGVTKRRGDLYPLLSRTLGLDPSTILHMGDNWSADVVQARAAGMQALWLPRSWWYRQARELADRAVRRRLRRQGWLGP